MSRTSRRFLMAGGGTGGHVIPLLAVARELRRRGHEPVFIGTRRGLEARLVPAEGFPIEWIEIGGLKSVGAGRMAKTLWQIQASTLFVARLIGRLRPAAVFSLGGFVAGPVMLAAALRRLPVVLMEPNAIPGFTNRHAGRFVARALVSFESARKWFPAGRSEVTGLPVREEFFAAAPVEGRAGELRVLITGGSQGSRTLNNAARAAWPLWKDAPVGVRLVHQTGTAAHEEIARDFAATGLDGEVVPFIRDMPAAFAAADVVVSRSGAGTVAELAAAGRPSILVPFPYAADNHQFHNAKALADGGAARVVEDAEMTGSRLVREIVEIACAPSRLAEMGRAARRFARPGAAARAAGLLEELAGRRAGQWAPEKDES